MLNVVNSKGKIESDDHPRFCPEKLNWQNQNAINCFLGAKDGGGERGSNNESRKVKRPFGPFRGSIFSKF